MPKAWFDRPQYAPRIKDEQGDRWFLHTPIATPMGELPSAFDRRAPHPVDLAITPAQTHGAVLATYETWRLPCPTAVQKNLAALESGDTLVVVTGQQPGFLTGPLYTIYKTLSAIALAAHVENASGRRCVPVFWVAGEDHDIDEIREARCPGSKGKEETFRLPHPSERRPLSSLPVDANTERVLDDVSDFFGERRHGDAMNALVDLYRGRNLASGFAAVLAELFGHHGLLLVDPERLRPLAAPIFKRVIENPADVLQAIEDGHRRVRERGLRPFVAPRLPLFLIQNGRRHHVTWKEGSLAIDGDGPRLKQEALLDLLAESPECFSSGALLRPIIQETVFRGAATVGGPAEVGYFEQLPPLCDWFGMQKPRIALRLQATLVEARAARQWRKLGLAERDLAHSTSPEGLVPLDARAVDIVEDVKRLEDDTRRVSARLKSQSTLSEPARRRLERSADKAITSASGLHARVDKEFRQNQRELSDAATTLWNHIFPSGVLQERRWNVFYYLSKYGRQWLDDLLEERKSSPLSNDHTLVFFEESKH